MMRRQKNGRTGAGFTLLELILVMAMLTIIIGLAAPTLSQFFRGRRLESEAHRFLSLVRYGQSRAAAEGIPMILWIDPKEGAYGLREEPGYSLEEDPSLLEYELADNLQLELLQISRETARDPIIRLQPDGTLGEISPPALWLNQVTGGTVRYSLCITQTQNRLTYEIISEPLPQSRARR